MKIRMSAFVLSVTTVALATTPSFGAVHHKPISASKQSTSSYGYSAKAQSSEPANMSIQSQFYRDNN